MKPRDAAEAVQQIAEEVADREQENADDRPATFLLIYNLSRFRELQKSDDDFGFGKFGEEQKASPAQSLANVLRDGPGRECTPFYGANRKRICCDGSIAKVWRDIDSRILFQMSATDSSNLMESSAASHLGQHRAIFYSDEHGRAERFRPYGLPDDDFMLKIRSLQSSPQRNEVKF